MSRIEVAVIRANEKQRIIFGTIDTDDLPAYQRAVGGPIEQIRLVGAHMYVNEEGAIHGLPINTRASAVAAVAIVGDALVTGADSHGNDADLPIAFRAPLTLLNTQRPA